MNILLIASGAFAPNNVIGAIRWTKIAKYLSLNDNIVTVIAQNSYVNKEDEILIRDAKLCHRIIFVNKSLAEKVTKTFYNIYGRIKRQPQNVVDNIFNDEIHMSKVVRVIGYYGFLCESKKIFKQKITSKFDVVISTNPISAHWAAMYAAKKYNIPWIADFRDPIAIPGSNSFYNLNMLRRQNDICQNASNIIAVSKGLKQVICDGNPNYIAKTAVIYNGFDPEDITPQKYKEHEEIKFVYAGILYSGKRDLSVIFEAIRSLADEGLIEISNISFEYAGNEFNTLKKQAEKYALAEILKDHGFVTRSESLLLQAQSDVLVMATYNDKGNPGVIPGKLYEYMMMRKPILAVVNGAIPDSELKEVIRESDVGFCYEVCSDRIDSLKAFIMSVELAKKKGSNLPYIYNTKRFEYPNIAKQVEDLIAQVIENHRDGTQ